MTESASPSSTSRANRAASLGISGIVLAYASFASLWILLSDRLVEWIFVDPARISLASTLKGGVFVIVTSLLLYGMLRRRAGLAVPLNAFAPSGQRPGLPLLMLMATILALTAAGIVGTATLQRDKEAARLEAIAELKTRQIGDWLQERQGDAGFVRGSAISLAHYHAWRDKGDLARRDRLQERLGELCRRPACSAILILDERGERLWGSPRASAAISPALRDGARQATADHQVHMAGPYADSTGSPRLDFIIPLMGGGAAVRPPVVVLQSDPADWLYPTLQTWPVPSLSGEALLVRRDGDQVLFLNELRHRRNAAANLRVPLAAPNLLAAQALRGEASPDHRLEGVDYRGVAVLGTARAVPGTDWFLVAKLDRAEAYDKATWDGIWIGLAGLLALFMAAAGAKLMRQRQQLALAAGVQESQAARLRALGLLEALAASSDDAIFAKDLAGRYILFTGAACRVVCRKVEDVLGRDDRALFPPQQAEFLMAQGRQVIGENRNLTVEEVLATVNGERVFLGTKGPLYDEDGKIIGIFGVSRDITEQKAADAALRRQAAELASRNAELERFNRASVGREMDMIGLKQIVNELSLQLGREAPFALAFLEAPAPPGGTP